MSLRKYVGIFTEIFTIPKYIDALYTHGIKSTDKSEVLLNTVVSAPNRSFTFDLHQTYPPLGRTIKDSVSTFKV